MPNANAGGKGQRGKGTSGGKGIGAGGGGAAGGSSQTSRAQPGDWPCHICDAQANRDWRERCRVCQAYRSVDMERAFAEHARKQAQAQQQRRSAQQRQQQQRQQQQQQQRQQSNKDDDDRRQLRQKVEALQAELTAARAQAGRPEDADDDAGAEEQEDDSDYSTWTEEERTKRIELARGGLAYAAAAFGEDSAQAQDLRDEIGALQRASREAKPFKAHRNQLERRRDDLRRKQERDEASVASAQAEIAELQGKVSALQTAIEDRAKQLKQVTDELTELVRKSLSDDRGGDEDENAQPAAAQACAPWSALAAAARGVSGQPGMPAEVGALLAQLQQVASTVIANATAAAAQAGPAASAPSHEGAAPAAAKAPMETKQRAVPSGVPVVLAPHGRFGKTAAKSSGLPPLSPQPATPPAATNASAEGSTSGGTAAAPTAATAATAGAAASVNTEASGTSDGVEARGAGGDKGGCDDDSDAEMVEADGADEGATEAEIEVSLSKLPARERRKILAAIRGGGQRDSGRKKDEGGQGDEESGRRERERSPRPTKLGDKDL